MSALSIKNLDDDTTQRLRARAARHGRSMESEVRAIIEDAVGEPAPSGLLHAMLDRFGEIGGADLELPARDTPTRAADLRP